MQDRAWIKKVFYKDLSRNTRISLQLLKHNFSSNYKLHNSILKKTKHLKPAVEAGIVADQSGVKLYFKMVVWGLIFKLFFEELLNINK